MKFHPLALLPLIACVDVARGQGTITWSVLDVALPKPISDMTATAGPDGLIYIAGGCDAKNGNVYNTATTYFDCLSSTDDFHSFNTETKEFVTLEPLPRPRYRHAAAVSNNHLWLIGGRTMQTDAIMEIDIYNFESKAWSTPGNHSEDTSDNAAFGDDDYVFVVGGYNTSYTARSSVWRITSASVDSVEIEEVAPLQVARGDIRAVTNDKGEAFVVSGFTDQNNFCAPLPVVEKYEIATDTWTFLEDVKSPGGDKALVELDGNVFTIGGEDQVDPTCSPTIDPPDPGEATVALDDVEMLEESGSWTTVASIPHARFRFDAEAVGSQVFVFGGQNAYNNTCQCYSASDEILVSTKGSAPSSAPGGAPTTSSAQYNSVIAAFMCVAIGVAGLA